jgi:hypothetical protein
MPSRSERRRRERGGEPPQSPGLFPVRELAIAVGIGAVLVGALVVFLLLPSSDEEVPEDDRQAIEALAKESVESLPRGEWPALYDSFTSEYQQRCSRPDFEAAGEAGAAEQGDNLPLLRFVRLEEVSIQGDNATAVTVGEITGQGEYRVRSAFQRADGEWKIAPAANTEGCAAFDRIPVASPTIVEEIPFPSGTPIAQ